MKLLTLALSASSVSACRCTFCELILAGGWMGCLPLGYNSLLDLA